MITYSPIKLEEVEKFYNLMKQLDRETDFMLYEADEREYQPEILKNIVHNSQLCGLLLAARDENNKMVGYLSANQSNLKRVTHTAYIVIGILADYHGQGIGTQLFLQLDEWAKHANIHRLELTVMADNLAAVALYQKQGFQIEGTKKDSIFKNGSYVDEYYMAKLI